MRLLLILVAVPVLAQVHFRGSAPLPFRGAPAARPQPVRPLYRGGYGLGYGYGGYGGYWGNSAMIPVPIPSAEPKPAPAPTLVSSSLYQADKGQPSLKEYGELPAPVPTAVSALVAFRDGRVEPVAAYWIEGDSFAYVAAGDLVKKVPASTVDTNRSESLNRQRGVTFHLPAAK